jgi:hypothetical protein
MTDDSTAVDIQSLEDFHATLATRLSDIDAVIAKMNRELNGPPALGGFADATSIATMIDAQRQQYADKVAQLRAAIVAAQSATTTIIANYRTTEDRNHANAADIARQLDGVGAALQDGASNA